MRISLLQTDIAWADKSANLQNTEKIIKNLSGLSDLIVLPEMFTTGFCTDRLDLAETMQGNTVQSLRQWAKEYQLAITGSFIATEGDKIFNRAFFVFPNGDIRKADKRHLFSPGGEDKIFSSGNDRLIVNYRGLNVCVLVCYDIRFPVWSRNRNNEYDLLVYTANFPHVRMEAWDVLLPARAIENQAYVCGVNRVGADGRNIAYSGHSILLDYQGKCLLDFSEYESGVKTIQIAKEPLDDFRRKYAFWRDADEFELK
ncbi:MAG: nitrilase family protein [Paludibacteraceae bacterium]